MERNAFRGAMMMETYLRAQGSRLAKTEEGEAAALNCLMSNPVGFLEDIVIGVEIEGRKEGSIQ